jgi:NADPH:quinone reductase-like Zn-dependent oxidoreductase
MNGDIDIGYCEFHRRPRSTISEEFLIMRAIQMDHFGGPEVLEVRDVDPPAVRDGEVLVRSIATSINPIDLKLRMTDRNLGFPLTLGWDLAGIVVESTTPEFRVGDRVIAMSNVLSTHNGTWADLVALPAADVALAPANATLIEAAALPLAGLTALQAWRSLTLASGSRVLVIGAAGAIGGFLVQLAVDSGVEVHGVVSRNEHVDEVKRFGAALVETDSEQLPGDAYDAILDTVGLPQSGVHAPSLLKASGEYIAVPSVANLPDGLEEARKVKVQRDPAGLKELAQLVDAGVLRLRVGATYPLRDVCAAHKQFEARGLLGKVVIDF